MALHIFGDANLENQFSEGDMSNPDFVLVEGETGASYNEKQLFLANEQTGLAAWVNELATEITLVAPRFADGDPIVVDGEQMLVVSGGGTNTLTVQRGHNETAPAVHEAGARVYTAYCYFLLGAVALDTSQNPAVTSVWCTFALTREGLETAQPGGTLQWISQGQPTFKAHDQALPFWRRVRCPAGTSVRYVRGVKWTIIAIEVPLMELPPLG